MTDRIEKATRADVPGIVDSWMASYRTAHAAGLIPMARWGDVMRPVVEAILARSTVIVARGSIPDSNRGWLAYEGDDLLHYMYVWKWARGRRYAVAETLLEAANLAPRFTYSCRTGQGERFLERMFPPGRTRPRFNPLPARFGSRPRQRKVTPVVEYKR
jgi:hypothetical protein